MIIVDVTYDSYQRGSRIINEFNRSWIVTLFCCNGAEL